jgi:hypothetical protein
MVCKCGLNHLQSNLPRKLRSMCSFNPGQSRQCVADIPPSITFKQLKEQGHLQGNLERSSVAAAFFEDGSVATPSDRLSDLLHI